MCSTLFIVFGGIEMRDIYISRPFFQSSIHKYANELGAIDIQTTVATALWLPLPICFEQC